MPTKTTTYACEHCNKLYYSKSTAKNHEVKCFHNPERRACQSCAFKFCNGEPVFDCADYMYKEDFEDYMEAHPGTKIFKLQDLEAWLSGGSK